MVKNKQMEVQNMIGEEHDKNILKDAGLGKGETILNDAGFAGTEVNIFKGEIKGERRKW